ncbi:MAG: YeiH family putative sulfate export transporter [Pseudomonadota bacterium]|nr:YeiH family putative sulfate export transporter [Pseudomonadota bacterium]
MGQRPLQPGVTAVTDIAVAEARLPKRVQLGAGGKFSAVPGLALTASVAGLAFAVRGIPGVGILSPMILATLLGMIFHNVVGTPLWAKPGVIFSLRRILRLGIILLGLQLMASQVAEVGFVGVGVILASLAGTFVFTKWLGRVLGVDAKLAELIAAGTSICGASAVIATNTVTEGSDEDVAYAVACVTVFGSLSMFLYPLLPALLHLNAEAYGLWSGASIHEIAQVVAAAFQDGARAGQFATVAKLTRIMMLAPVVITLGLLAARRAAKAPDQDRRKAPPMPWFVLGFIAMVLLNSLVTIPAAPRHLIVMATTFLLSMALAAMGLETDFRKLKAEGVKPLALAAAAWLFISVFALVLVKLSLYA